MRKLSGTLRHKMCLHGQKPCLTCACVQVVVRLRPSTDAAADCVVIKHKDKNSTVPDAVQLKADEHNPVNDPSQLYPFFFSASPHVSQSRLFKGETPA